MQKQFKKLNALIFGATGAVGRELVRALANSPRWGKITLVVRNQLEQWNKLQNKDKLIINKVESLDKLLKVEEWSFANEINSVFCCLGSRVGQGEETFVKIDKTFPLCIADIAKLNKIRHYCLVSSTGADPNSWFLYPRTKGQVERDLKLKQLEKLSIFQPGFLDNRYDPRPIEKIVSYLPFFPKIDVKDVAKCIMKQAEKSHDNQTNQKINVYNNSQMLALIGK